MGLDMWAYGLKASKLEPEDAAKQVDVNLDVMGEKHGVKEVHYWRKHPNLHGWMERLYREKGGTQEMFNAGSNVRLELEDLAKLELAIRTNKLPHTTGFFYGQSDGSEAYDDLDFIASAREMIDDGYAIFYTSWW